MSDCIKSVKTLLIAGADKTIPNFEGYMAFQMLNDKDVELKELLTV